MNDEPIVLLKQLYANHSPISLLNVYKGLPISNEANITGVDAFSISVSSIKSQIVCMFLNRETYIQSPLLPSAIKANVLEFKVSQMEAKLGNLQFAQGRIGGRRQVRVVPVESIIGIVQPKNSKGMIKAELADISHNGLAIFISRRIFISDIFKAGAEMIVELTLPVITNTSTGSLFNFPREPEPIARFSRENLRGMPGLFSSDNTDGKKERRIQAGQRKIMVRAEIKDVKLELKMDRVRIGMSIFTNAEAQTVISSFISQRQAELVREIKTLYELLSRSND